MVKRRKKKKVAAPPMRGFIRCHQSTLHLIRLAAEAEAVTQSALIDSLVRQYAVERGLEKPIAQLVAHAEAAEIQRRAWLLEARKEWEQEQETRDEILPKH